MAMPALLTKTVMLAFVRSTCSTRARSVCVVQVGGHDLDRMAGILAEADRQPFESLSITGDEDQLMTAPCQAIGIRPHQCRKKRPL